MCYSPTKVAKITIMCCVLHICRKNKTSILGPKTLDEPLYNTTGEDWTQSSLTRAIRQRLVDML